MKRARGKLATDGGTQQKRGSEFKDAIRNKEMWGERAVRRSRDEHIAAAVAERVQTGSTTALYQPLALPGASSDRDTRAGSVEQRVLELMVAGQQRTSAARLAGEVREKVHDKGVLLFVPRAAPAPRKHGRVAAAYARHSTRPRRLAEPRGRTVRRAAPPVAAAAAALAAMAADGRQLAGLALTVRASRRLPHLVGREFTVLGAYRARSSVLLYDAARAQTVRCEVDDVQACYVPRFRAVLPLRKLVQSTLS